MDWSKKQTEIDNLYSIDGKGISGTVEKAYFISSLSVDNNPSF